MALGEHKCLHCGCKFKKDKIDEKTVCPICGALQIKPKPKLGKGPVYGRTQIDDQWDEDTLEIWPFGQSMD